MLIGKLSSSSSYEGEANAQHRFTPKECMDTWSSVFRSRYVQGRAVEQFSLPQDEDLLKEAPDVGLHAILRSYLMRGCLVERELYQRLARGHDAFERLREAYETRGNHTGDELDQVVKELSSKQAELDGWRQEMAVREQQVTELKASNERKSVEIEELRQKLRDGDGGLGSLTEALNERDVALARVALEKQVAQHARSQLEEESSAKQKLVSECALLEESLRAAKSRVEYLESESYRSSLIEERRPAIVGEFQRSALGEFEVALAYKTGCDYTVSQLPNEYQEASR